MTIDPDCVEADAVREWFVSQQEEGEMEIQSLTVVQRNID